MERKTENRTMNLLTDYGFKRVFGEKDIMMAFLTDLLQPKSPIADLTFLDKELEGMTEYDRGVVYDRLQAVGGAHGGAEGDRDGRSVLRQDEGVHPGTSRLPRQARAGLHEPPIDYWLYAITNMETMTTNIPFQHEQPIFGKVGNIAELIHMNPEDRKQYNISIDTYRTNLSVMKNERAEGLAENKAIGMPLSQIAQITGLDEAEIS